MVKKIKKNCEETKKKQKEKEKEKGKNRRKPEQNGRRLSNEKLATKNRKWAGPEKTEGNQSRTEGD